MQRMKLALAERHFLPIAIATLQLLIAASYCLHCNWPNIFIVLHILSVSFLGYLLRIALFNKVQCSVRKCQIAAGGQAQEALEALQTLETIRVMPSGGWHFLVSMSTLLHPLSASKVDSATILLPSKSTKNGRGSIQRLHHSSQSTSTSNLTPLCKKVLF